MMKKRKRREEEEESWPALAVDIFPRVGPAAAAPGAVRGRTSDLVCPLYGYILLSGLKSRLPKSMGLDWGPLFERLRLPVDSTDIDQFLFSSVIMAVESRKSPETLMRYTSCSSSSIR